jgi:hypothetical protein
LDRRTLFAALPVRTLGALVALVACTEDPTLDRVGGSGSNNDARPECPQVAADAQPRFLPCNVEAVLRAKCQRCHNSKAVLDRCYPAKTCVRGPFPLLTWSDTHALQGSTPTFELMRRAVESGLMPFQTTDISPPVEPLDAEEKATLINWAKACAPAGSKACPASEDGGDSALDGAPSGDK